MKTARSPAAGGWVAGLSLRIVTTALRQEGDVFVDLDASRNDVGLHATPERDHVAKQRVVRRDGAQLANKGLVYLQSLIESGS